ncbi:putative E3 ubiquitin-protein ligase UNKL isoform X4 [Phlebotomus papatasi]|uniref:putative E3 ubiquitin-protein ligase UNKL isoform X4 n=1 Tax=Phlebotomus papatasi TaxID=29031 RepID=UPI0024843F6F|nr:putative E3 ubiquitin-protein ligase UNKL isoform X4 [Phlebotomus papatasi]
MTTGAGNQDLPSRYAANFATTLHYDAKDIQITKMAEKIMATTQQEKPNHYNYLKEFRVEQCQSFLQHKCNQHRPFICFNWHFMNQRRRRPIRKRDGTFNYSADNYCTKYDETTGICPDGDDCPFLHRTAGDTERRYHLRYYKTCMCVHDTDARGNCVKNGHHCAFAHGVHDQRPPVYDIKELESLQAAENNGEGLNGPNALDKERNLMNEDPKWQDTNYVLANYKTEPCKRPPRLCRQGYACPQYHNSKDKRRSPRKYKYRSTPCPNVKHGEEWGEPANCEAGDNCQYCHTRTEQQFHPEIYKSTKCNDVQQAGYCPRSVFCAFAHVEPYILTEDMQNRDLDGPTSNLALADIISNALPQECKKDKNDMNISSLHNGSGESSESASTSSLGSNGSHNKAPGSQLHQKMNVFSSNLNNNCQNVNANSSMTPFSDLAPEINKQLLAIENDPTLGPLEKDQRKRMCLTFLGSMPTNVFSAPNNSLERDLLSSHIENSLSAGIASVGLLQNSTAPVNIPNSPIGNPISGLFQGASAPVNIPGSSLGNFSPSSNRSNLFSVGDPFSHIGSGSAPKINNSFGPGDGIFFQSHLISPGLGDPLSISPEVKLREDLANNGSLFDNGLSHSNKAFSMSPCLNAAGLTEISRLKDELASKNAQLINYEEQMMQSNKAYEAWKMEIDESNRKTAIAEQQRDEALSHVKALKDKLDLLSAQNGSTITNSSLRGMSLQKLKTLQTKLKNELEEVEKMLYLETATKCMKCEENNRTVTLAPCNHYVLCDSCATTVRECPYCQTPVQSQT